MEKNNLDSIDPNHFLFLLIELGTGADVGAIEATYQSMISLSVEDKTSANNRYKR
jgi:hypothetical protein